MLIDYKRSLSTFFGVVLIEGTDYINASLNEADKGGMIQDGAAQFLQ